MKPTDHSHAVLPEPLLTLELPGITKIKSGKVREMFDLGDCLLMVATDRISAFDCIMPNGIPLKGVVLTQISHFWFDQLATIVANHRLARADDPLPPFLKPHESKLARRSMIVKKALPLPIECVVRGYLAGSGWKEYRQNQTVCGIRLPQGLVESSELPEPIFTPAAQRGIIIADPKSEFGTYEGRLILIDELLPPDSSRFWPADHYQPGRGQPSFDKQFVRDYLETQIGRA